MHRSTPSSPQQIDQAHPLFPLRAWGYWHSDYCQVSSFFFFTFAFAPVTPVVRWQHLRLLPLSFLFLPPLLSHSPLPLCHSTTPSISLPPTLSTLLTTDYYSSSSRSSSLPLVPLPLPPESPSPLFLLIPHYRPPPTSHDLQSISNPEPRTVPYIRACYRIYSRHSRPPSRTPFRAATARVNRGPGSRFFAHLAQAAARHP